MVSTTTGPTDPTEDSDSVVSLSSCNVSRKAAKTHDFTEYQCGTDYYFEWTSVDMKACMTGQGKGIKPNDYILLQPGSTPQCYQVEIIDYYSHPSDMWIALLKPITQGKD